MTEVYSYLESLLKKDDVIILGCSGGPDSMALLNVLLNVRKKIDIKIICAHVNHNVRKESFKEASFLEEYCLKKYVVFEHMVINKYGDDNFHNEARTIRYNFFMNLLTKYNGNYLMTAHHGDDLIETILMRIVRGSTLGGYAGFSKEVVYDDYKLIRPLITVTKQEILEYDKKNKIPYVIDKSNFKDKYTRNRYRKYVLPFLKKEDINVNDKFLKFSMTLNMYDNYIEKEIEGLLKKIYVNNSLDINKYKKLDVIIKNKVIYHILQEFYQDDLILINDTHVNLINSLINSRKANTYSYLPNDVKVIKSYDKLVFTRLTEEIDSYEIELSSYAHLPNCKVIEEVKEQTENNNNYCRLNKSDIVLPLTVRTRKQGDKMRVKGMNKEKKVKDIFINSKISIKDRDIWPIVVDAKGTIVWIPGLKKSYLDVDKNKKCDIILKYY